MNTKFALLVLIALLSFSCKNDKAAPVVDKPEVVAVRDDIFTVAFDLVVEKDDNMQLYYTVDGSINFDEKNSMWFSVTGKKDAQEIQFKLPVGVIPTTIRVDFGHGKNELQSNVELKSFRMKFNDNVEEVKGPEIFKYFVAFEPYTDIVDGTTILKRKKKDQDVGPILYPLEAQAQLIERLIRG